MVGIVGYSFLAVEGLVDNMTNYFGFFFSIFFSLLYFTIYNSSCMSLTMVLDPGLNLFKYRKISEKKMVDRNQSYET